MTKEKINPDDYITKREATLILGFKIPDQLLNWSRRGI